MENLTKVKEVKAMTLVLVVDQDEFCRNFLGEELAKEGYQVEKVDSSQKVLHLLEGGDYDLVIIDVDVEDLSGLEAITLLKREYPHLPVIAMTSNNSLQLEREVRERGVFYFFIKSLFGLDEIKEAVKAAIYKGKV